MENVSAYPTVASASSISRLSHIETSYTCLGLSNAFMGSVQNYLIMFSDSLRGRVHDRAVL